MAQKKFERDPSQQYNVELSRLEKIRQESFNNLMEKHKITYPNWGDAENPIQAHYQTLKEIISKAQENLEDSNKDPAKTFEECISKINFQLNQIEKNEVIQPLIKQSNNRIKKYIQDLCDKFNIKLFRPKTQIEQSHSDFKRKYKNIINRPDDNDAQFSKCQDVSKRLQGILSDQVDKILVFHPTKTEGIYHADSEKIQTTTYDGLTSPKDGGIVIIVDKESALRAHLESNGFKVHKEGWAAESQGKVALFISPCGENNMDDINALPEKIQGNLSENTTLS